MIKNNNNLIKLLLICSSLTLGLASSVIAETTASNNSSYGFPTHRRDGGSRNGQCLAQSSNLVAIVPENRPALNASASPRLFFYVPEIKHQKVLEFVLRNEKDELIYEAFLTTNGNGIIDVEIPEDIKSRLFEEDRNYRWYLSMICDAQQRSRDIVVQGWLRQSELDAQTRQQLNSSTAIERANIYQDRGLWHDALSVLAETKETDTDNVLVAKKWTELLKSVNLGELASQPLVDSKLIETPQNSETTTNSWLPE